jgi:hypothetical protein
MTEPFWEFWANALPVQVQAEDALSLTLTERARLPIVAKQGFRGLDLLRAEIKAGRPGIIIRSGYHRGRLCEFGTVRSRRIRCWAVG